MVFLMDFIIYSFKCIAIIAIIRKLEIDNRIDLTDAEKELMKQFIDFIKEQVR